MAGKRDLQIESNIWRDRMQYAFKLHSCLLGFSFANDRCGCHWSMDRIGLSAFISHTSPLVRVSSGKFVDQHHSRYLHNLIVFGSFFSYFQIQIFECRGSKQSQKHNQKAQKAYREAQSSQKSLQRN
ncbi:uncharacterized protein LOC131073610 isoform X2 [Cryptomeria japonica]|uniref:uncharacterized protein LOC131073610 isoform X2 n=1 Tax=Cryptomeria japonica TaxID=3369 RepID=UPI0025AD1B5C|nr:uncharacterized protein LOC131073610 isoform X2 [Cryptomeria japonica]